MITKALKNLGVTNYTLEDLPQNEAEFLASFKKITGETAEGLAIESSDPAEFGVTWAQVQAEIATLTAAEPLRLLREERNRLLAETDWWAVADRTMTTAETTYRQALRDITETYSSLEDVVWPVKPE